MTDQEVDITPELLLNAYAAGIFPMSEDRDDDTLFWVEPDERCIIPLNQFHVSKRLARTVKRDHFDVYINKDFRGVMQGCAEAAAGRETTWISKRIEDLYCTLNEMGYAHSVECYSYGELVGGLYGVCIAGAFFGESMFHRESDASKVALVHLVGRMKAGGYTLLDAQFKTDHLGQFGAIEVPKKEYKARLEDAMHTEADFHVFPTVTSGKTVLQPTTQTS